MKKPYMALMINMMVVSILFITIAFAEDGVYVNQSVDGSSINNNSGHVYGPTTQIVGNTYQNIGSNNIDNSYVVNLSNEINESKAEFHSYVSNNNTYNLGVTVSLSVSIVLNLYLLYRSRKHNAAIKILLLHCEVSNASGD